MDLSSVLLRNRIIFIGQAINSQVAQRVISELMTLAAIDENEDIQVTEQMNMSGHVLLHHEDGL
jgi:ATP-dependent Clp protease protease subunit